MDTLGFLSQTGIYVIEECTSTQVLLANMPHQKAVLALAQTQGKGRMGREWKSSKNGGMYLSWRPQLNQRLANTQYYLLALLTAKTIAAFLSKQYPQLQPKIKWPNDILVDGLKLCGILCEAKSQGEDMTLIVGIGLNIEHAPLSTSIALRQIPSCVNLGIPTALSLAASLIPALDAAVEDFLMLGKTALLAEWRRFELPIGTLIKRGDQEGRYLGIDEDGCLRLELQNSKIICISSGEVQLVDFNSKHDLSMG